MAKRYIGLVGVGYWGKNILRNLYKLDVLHTVCEVNKKIIDDLKEEYPEINYTVYLDELLQNREITGIFIATPALTHYDITKKSLLAYKHVFVEKPLALTVKEGEELVSIAQSKKKILMVGHILQYHPAVVRLKEMVKNGTIGRLQYIYSRRLSLGKIRREENILWSFAPHDISVILSLVGEEPNYVDAVGNNFLHARIADVTMTNLKFPSGVGAHVFVSWLNPFKEQRLVVIGEKGMIVFDDTLPVEQKLVLYSHTIHWENNIPVPQKAEGTAISLNDVWDEPLKLECTAFLKAIETGKEPITNGLEGLKVLRVLELSQKSLEEKERLISNPGLRAKGGGFGNEVFIHPTAIIDENVSIGKGTKIWQFTHILSGAKIGNNCNIGQNVSIERDVIIGNNCKIQNNVSVYKGVTLEDGVFCGPSMVFTNVLNPRAELSKMHQLRPTLVRKGATLGANCTIICGHIIGRYAFVGAGAVVTKDVPDHALVVGNPARQIGWVCECGERLNQDLVCLICNKRYRKTDSGLELESAP